MRAAPLECDTIVRNAHVITGDARGTVYPNGAVAVDGNRIAMVGPEPEVLAGCRGRDVLDAGGAPVHPGFVECHYHLSNHITRGVFPDVPSAEGYYLHYARWYDAIEPAEEYATTVVAALEMLRAGITAFMEPGTVFDTAAVASAIADVGIRASLAEPFLWDTGEDFTLSNMRRAPADTNRCRRLLGSELWRNRDPDALVRGHVCLYGHGTATDEVLVAATDLAQEEGVAFTQHQSANLAAVTALEARLGRQPLLHLDRLGVLRPHCAYTHMNVIRPAEAAAVRESGMSLIWCPANSMNWGVGRAGLPRPQPELHRAGVNVGLGTDTPKFGFDASPMMAYLLARDAGAGAPLGAGEVFAIATMGGARALRMSHLIGSLEPGKRADLVVRDAEPPEPRPGFDPLQDLLLASRGRTVGTVMVDGRIVLRGGRSTRIDEAAAHAAARTAAGRLASRAGVRLEPDGAERR